MLAVGDYSIVPIYSKYIDYTGWLSNSIKLISVFIALIIIFYVFEWVFFFLCVSVYILVFNIVNMIKYTTHMDGKTKEYNERKKYKIIKY